MFLLVENPCFKKAINQHLSRTIDFIHKVSLILFTIILKSETINSYQDQPPKLQYTNKCIKLVGNNNKYFFNVTKYVLIPTRQYIITHQCEATIE